MNWLIDNLRRRREPKAELDAEPVEDEWTSEPGYALEAEDEGVWALEEDGMTELNRVEATLREFEEDDE